MTTTPDVAPTRPRTLALSLLAQAAHRPDLRLGTVDDQLTLGDAVGIAVQRARALLDDGLRPGQRVALVAGTSTDYILTWMACLFAGTPVALVNPTYPPSLTADVLAPLAPVRVLSEADVGIERHGSDRDPAALPGLAVDPFDVASYMHTSGTTGLPKFCAQTHDYFHRLSDAVSGAFDLDHTDRVLAPLPLFHINPMGYGIITSLLTGADALAVRKFSARGFWPTVIEEAVTVLVLHAPPVEILKRSTTQLDAAGHTVRTMFYADGEFLARFGIPKAVSGYGSTEAGGLSHLARWSTDGAIPADASRHGGAGRADIQWRLSDTGEIALRERERAAMFDGYVTASGLNDARDAEGWFDTGDLGRVENGNSLVFVERSSESIRVKGEFVPIPFVENHLAAVPGIADHALWKRKGELVDDEVVLYVVADTLPLPQLTASIAELPPFMRPVAVAHVADLPRDAAAGKVQRRRLTDHPVLRWLELP